MRRKGKNILNNIRYNGNLKTLRRHSRSPKRMRAFVFSMQILLSARSANNIRPSVARNTTYNRCARCVIRARSNRRAAEIEPYLLIYFVPHAHALALA